MRSILILSAILALSACTDVSVKRERGQTVGGYTTYATTLTVYDEPACAGSCKP